MKYWHDFSEWIHPHFFIVLPPQKSCSWVRRDSWKCDSVKLEGEKISRNHLPREDWWFLPPFHYSSQRQQAQWKKEALLCTGQLPLIMKLPCEECLLLLPPRSHSLAGQGMFLGEGEAPGAPTHTQNSLKRSLGHPRHSLPRAPKSLAPAPAVPEFHPCLFLRVYPYFQERHFRKCRLKGGERSIPWIPHIHDSEDLTHWFDLFRQFFSCKLKVLLIHGQQLILQETPSDTGRESGRPELPLLPSKLDWWQANSAPHTTLSSGLTVGGGGSCNSLHSWISAPGPSRAIITNP